MVNGTYNNSNFKGRRKELRVNQTDAEKILWQELRGRKLEKCKFWRQYSVGPYILDFYFPQILRKSVWQLSLMALSMSKPWNTIRNENSIWQDRILGRFDTGMLKSYIILKT